MKKPQGLNKEQMLYAETARQKVLQLFYKFPDKEFSLSDIAKEARVAKANLGVILVSLEAIGLIKIERLTKIWRVKSNQENWMFKRAKIVYNLNFIYQSGLVEFLNQSYNNPKAIILFGSFRKGEDTSSSDIDIAIESDVAKDYKVLGLRELSDFEKAIGRSIQIHEFNRKFIDDGLFNNIANGIVLMGFLEVRK
ncbi:hypothetical protein COU60_04380 [Candidatus Pacearchaeota archaeon CG10_big_fil_rev_8_21_14_0_10_34_76]|nr:MAG: hypothetical protein COU60_04380 [Candidatus Pacearchaeota archaeon CG10_big_fil_rev_8_21_14_0_10_34_76]